MRRFRVAPALPVLAAVLLFAPAARAQQEPPLFPETPAAPAPTPTAQAIAPARPATAPQPPLRASLDFTRWQEMSPRERQTFVEGAVLVLGSFATRLRSDLALDGRVPPETLAAVIKMVDANYPTRSVPVYLREMDSIYLTPEGQKLSILECFLQAFRRANAR